jgi:hypothetical protein
MNKQGYLIYVSDSLVQVSGVWGKEYDMINSMLGVFREKNIIIGSENVQTIYGITYE